MSAILTTYFENFCHDIRIWAKWFFAIPVGSRRRAIDLAEIRNPWFEYSIHWVIKSAEVSSFISGIIIHPIYRYYLYKQLTPETKTNNSYKKIRNACRRMQGRCLIGAICVAPFLSFAYVKGIKNWSDNELKDQVYFIRKNFAMRSFDRYSMTLGVIGWYWKRFQGAVDGINIGMVVGFLNAKVKKTPLFPDLSQQLDYSKEPIYNSMEDAMANKDKFTKFWYETHGEMPSNSVYPFTFENKKDSF